MSTLPTDPRFEAVLQVARAIASTLDLDVLLERMMSTVTVLLGAERSTLYVVEPDSGDLWSRVAQADEHLVINLAKGAGLAGWVAEHGQPVVLDDAYDDERFSRSWDESTGYRTRALLCAPFRNAAGEVVGVMQCLNKEGGFTPDDLHLLDAIGGQCAVAIENARLVRSLEARNVELGRAEGQLRRANAELQILVDLEGAIALSANEDIFVRQVLHQLCELFDADGAAAVLAQGDAGRIMSLHGGRQHTVVIDKKWATALLERFDSPMILDGSDADSVMGVRAVSAPLDVGGERLGALQVLHGEEEGYEGGVRVLGLVAGRVARALRSQRRRAKEEREERLSLVGQMMSGILHDLRTPMSAVVGYAELMAEEPDPDERDDLASRVRQALRQMEQLTSEVLEFARGESQITLQTLPMADFVADVTSVMAPDLDRFGTVLTLDGDLDGDVRFDAARMRRVVCNLGRNAGEAGAKHLIWRMHRSGDTLRMELQDDGPGIPDEVRGRLFEPFATFGKSGGTGLGLAMVRSIVEAHGGKIRVDPVSDGGAVFAIELPMDPLEGTPLL